MFRVIRCAAAVLLLVAVPALVGCGPSKKDGTPNPDLQVPDIPAGGHGSKDMSKDKKADKKGDKKADKTDK